MNYRFKHGWHGFAKGQQVPAEFNKGLLTSLIELGEIEEVPEEQNVEKAMTEPPADKSMSRRPGKVRNKGVES